MQTSSMSYVLINTNQEGKEGNVPFLYSVIYETFQNVENKFLNI